MKIKKLRWLVVVLEVVVIIFLINNLEKIRELIDPKANLIRETIWQDQVEQTLPTITPILVKEITPKIEKIYRPTPTINNEPWGVAKQIDEVTWTMKIGEDKTMATAREIYEALNEYRKVQGSQVLTWDEKLVNYAQERAKYLNSIKTVDKHAGFNDFMENQDGFNKLGFTSLGENISFGYKLNGVHTIEWIYAGDKPHNDNQLNTKWDHVGIGVDGLATCLIFGTGKF